MRRLRATVLLAGLALTAFALANVESTVDATPPRLDPADFAPIVYLHRQDHLRPASAASSLRKASLRWDHRQCSDVRFTSFTGSEADIERLARGEFRHRAARGLSRLCRLGGRTFRSNELTRPFHRNSAVPKKEGFYLAFPKNSAFRFGAKNRSATPDRTYEGAPAYVARGRNHVTYWFFYPYSSPFKAREMGRRRDAAHEGDWENVTVHLVDGEPRHIAYFKHGDTLVCAWPDVPRDPQSGRPIVYSAWGSHASFASPGGHGLDLAAKDLRWDTARDLHALPAAVDGTRLQQSNDPEVAWYGYGGGWGRVGKATKAPHWFTYATDTTGPLGPSLYKQGIPASWAPRRDCR